MRKSLLLSIILLAVTSIQAQRTCGTDAHELILQQTDAHYTAHRQEIDRFTQNYIATHPNGSNTRTSITIPVVVHVVYSDSAGDISDAQIQSQIARLNTDYNKENSDTGSVPAIWKSTAANIGIHWCLAVRDPNGNATTGIRRVRTSTTSFSQNDAVKYTAQGGDDAWPASSYLNIWVCNLGGGLLGYSQFPGGPAATDGCVILNTGFGDQVGTTVAPYNLGRTVTHEVGHWLNLYHPFQGGCTGGDSCADTPPTAAATYSCPTFPLLGSGCSTTSPGIMFMDYMDYVDDACMYMFTNDQNARIQALFVPGGWRAAILNSLGCQAVNPGPTPNFTANKTSICVGQAVTFTDQSTGSPTSWTWTFAGGTPSTYTGQTPPAVTYSTAGTYTVTLSVSNSLGTNSLTRTGYITVQGTTQLPLQEGFQTTTFVPAGWTLSNPDNNTAWARSTTAGGYGTSTASAYFDNFNANYRGQRDYMYTPIYNFANTNASTRLKFDYAYQRDGNAADNDSLEFIYSTDCGATWTRLWQKGGTALQTVTTTNINTGFTPTAAQWKTDSVNLGFLAGQSSVQFGVVNICNYGQNIYVDNINIDTPLCNRAAAPTSVTLPGTAPCTGATATYSVPTVTGATSYVWSVSTGWSGTSTTNSITLTAGNGDATVSVSAVNACGASTPYVFTAPHGAVPAAPTSVTLPSTPCANAQAAYTVPAVSGATSYTWTVSGAGWSGSSTTNSITLTAGTAAASVSVTANSACGAGTAYVFSAPVNTTPAAPTSVTLPTAPCANATAVYTVPAVSGATSYTWTVSGTGWSGTSTTNSITLTAGTGTGSVSVTANNSCGSSAAYVFAPASGGSAPAAAVSITAPTSICSGSQVTFTTPSITGATSYHWTVSGTGWTGTSTTNSITLTAGTGPLTISVNGVNNCGSGTSTSLSSVPVVASPVASFTESSHTANTGANVTVTFGGTAPAGTTYTWNFNGGNASPGTGAGPQTVSWPTVGTYTVSLTLDNNGCTSTYTDTVQVSKINGIDAIGLDAIDAINIVPNPSSGQTTIIISMTSEAAISITAYDMSGRLVSTIYNGELGAGEKSITFNTESISAGIYVIKATDGKTFIQKRFVKM